jgi:hypothetical protein
MKDKISFIRYSSSLLIGIVLGMVLKVNMVSKLLIIILVVIIYQLCLDKIINVKTKNNK